MEIEIDETNEIRLSSFDAVRREIAKRALEKLIKDARIQPSRIEEVIALEKFGKLVGKIWMLLREESLKGFKQTAP